MYAILGIAGLFCLYGLNIVTSFVLKNGSTTSYLPFLDLYTMIGLSGIWYIICGINNVDLRFRRPVFLFGNYAYTAGPGLCFIEPVFYSIEKDVSVQDAVSILEIPKVQTKDNVGLGLRAVLTCAVGKDHEDVRKAVVNVRDVMGSVLMVAESVIATVGSTQDLDDILTHRVEFSKLVVEKLQATVGVWGVKVSEVSIVDLKISDAEIEKAIAQKARAKKEGEAEVERARYALQAVEQLNLAGAAMSENARWLRAMDQLTTMAHGPNNTFFVVPTMALDALGNLGNILPKK